MRSNAIGELNAWEARLIALINTFTDEMILKKIRMIMRGYSYSWYSISEHLQAKCNNKELKLEHLEPGNILYEWNVLCDERIHWQRHGQPSFRSHKFNKVCLVYLMILPTQAGLGVEGQGFVTRNLDKIGLKCKSLAVEDPRELIDSERAEFRGNEGYFYAEGPQFRIEYIHDRVEY